MESQSSKIRMYCDLHDLHLLRVVDDPGESGKTLDRPGIRQVLEDLAKGRADGIVITKLDRLTRYLGDWVHLIERYFDERAGCHLFSVGDSVDTRTAAGRMVLNIIMSVAQWERETIAERTKDALQAKIARGERCGRLRYGSDLNPDGKTLRPNDHEQRVIGMMKKWQAEGKQYREMVELLNELGIATKTGSVWYPSTVHQILRRPIA